MTDDEKLTKLEKRVEAIAAFIGIDEPEPDLSLSEELEAEERKRHLWNGIQTRRDIWRRQKIEG